ncbi:MAG: response regulator, partial [Leptospiraceae bacterium]|nr:response regulator [Leptospiraceae bacterium]
MKEILIVEDEVIAALALKGLLRSSGYRVTDYVASGEDAITSIKEHKPDIILMDITIAGELDGIETYKIIKSEEKIPVIFLSGYDDDSIRKKAEETNPLGYFLKPYEF